MTPFSRTSLAATLLLILSVACTPGIDNQTRLQIAREHETRGDYITAILELKNSLQIEPNDITVLALLGRLSLHAGQSGEAINYLQRARSLGADAGDVLEPLGQALLAQGQFAQLLELISVDQLPPSRRGRIWLLRGRAHTNLGQSDQATVAFRHAMDDRSTESEALAGLASLAIAEGRLDDADLLIDAALELDPFAVTAHRTLGALRLAQQRDEEALEAFVHAVEATRVRPGADDLLLARVGLTETQWRLGQKSRALGNVKDLLDAYPWHPLPRYLRALLAYDSGEYALASEYLREVLTMVPRHRPSQQLLAAADFELGNFASTELLLRDYLPANPDDLTMRMLLATTHLRLGNPPGAMATLLPGLEAGRDDPAFLALLGRAALHAGDVSTAAAYLFQAARRDPGNAQTRVSLISALIGAGHLNRAERELAALPPDAASEHARSLLRLALMMRANDPDTALEYAKEIRQTSPSNLHAMLALAELAEERGDSQRAIDWLEMAVSRNPTAVEPRLLLVRYYHDRGDHQRAHAMAVEAVQIKPQQAEALVALAREKLDLGQTPGAIRTFEEALRASPESAEALLGLAAAAAQRRDVDAAGELLGRAMQVDERLAPLASAIVVGVAESGDASVALELARHLQRAGSHLPDGYAAAGDVHMTAQRYADARAAYESAMLRSDDPVVALKTYIAAREAGHPHPEQLLQKWLQAHPGNASVSRMLASTRSR